MSKSKGTGVFLDVSADDMYGQVMAQGDDMIELLFINLTDLPLVDIKLIANSENPKNAKMALAFEITKIFHGESEAKKAEENFEKTFTKRGTPEDVIEVSVAKGIALVDILMVNGIVVSKSDFRRLVSEGAITNMDTEEKITNADQLVSDGIYKIGKRRFIKIKVL